MTKKEFFILLSERLKSIPNEKLGDILFDYQDYFNSLDSSISEETAISNLGDINEIIENYIDLYKNDSIESPDFIEAEPITISKDNISNFNTNKDKIISREIIDKKEKNHFKRLFKLPNFKRKTSFKKFFSLPLYILLLPLLFILALAGFITYISAIGITFFIGLVGLFISSIPLLISFSGVLALIARSILNATFYNIPDFIMEFPSLVIVLLVFAFFFFSLGLFNLTFMYFKLAIQKVKLISKSLLNFFFTKEDTQYEEVKKA